MHCPQVFLRCTAWIAEIVSRMEEMKVKRERREELEDSELLQAKEGIVVMEARGRMTILSFSFLPAVSRMTSGVPSVVYKKNFGSDAKDALCEHGANNAKLYPHPTSTWLFRSSHSSHNANYNPSSYPNMPPPMHPCILPYHERKRLIELEEERNRKKNARMEAKMNNGKGRGEGRESRNKSGGRNGNDGEKTPLNGGRIMNGGLLSTLNSVREYNAYGSTMDDSGNDNNYGSNNQQKQQQSKLTGWFGQIAAMVRGNLKQRQSQLKHQRYGSIEDESKMYRDRGQAFLKKTEAERLKMKEKSKLEELNNVTIPVNKQSL